MTVYVVQERKRYDPIAGELVPAVNLMPAAEYGNLIELFNHRQHSLLSGPIVRAAKEKLKDFSDGDYLLPIGDPVLIGVATAIAAEKNMGRVKLLHWDRSDKRYIVLEYDMRNI